MAQSGRRLRKASNPTANLYRTGTFALANRQKSPLSFNEWSQDG